MHGAEGDSPIRIGNGLLGRAGEIAAACSPDALFGAMLSDKKKIGAQIHFVLLEDWGRAIVLPLDPSDLRAALPAIL